MATNLKRESVSSEATELFSPEEAEEYIVDILAELQAISRVTENIRLQYYLLQARESAMGVEVTRDR